MSHHKSFFSCRQANILASVSLPEAAFRLTKLGIQDDEKTSMKTTLQYYTKEAQRYSTLYERYSIRDEMRKQLIEYKMVNKNKNEPMYINYW